MATPMQQAGISNTQEEAILGAVQEQIGRALDAAGNEAAKNLFLHTGKMEELLVKMQSQQEEVMKHVDKLNTEKDLMQKIMDQFHSEGQTARDTLGGQTEAMKTLNGQLTELKYAKDQVASDMVARNAEMNDMVTKLREASSEAFQRLQQSYGGIDTRFIEFRRDANART